MPWAFNGYYNDMTEYVKFMIKEKGQTISDEDAKDLAEFVLSIGAENEYYGAVQVLNDDTTYNKFNAELKITGLSVIKQIAGAPDGKVTVTVYDANGKELDSASADLSGLYYGVVYDITFDEVYTRNLKIMDMTAFTLCKENGLNIIVFDMDTEGNLMKVLQGENIGTLVHK